MFILGLVVGPAVGLLAGDYLMRSSSVGVWQSALAVFFLLVFLLFAPFFQLELKLGLITGLLVGLLLVLTPIAQSADDATLPQ